MVAPSVIQLSRFSLIDAIGCGARLRARACDASDLTAAAEAVATFLYGAFEPACTGVQVWWRSGPAAGAVLAGVGAVDFDGDAVPVDWTDPVGVRLMANGSLLVLGGALIADESFVVLLATGGPVDPSVVRLFGLVAANVRLGLLAHRPDSAEARAEALTRLMATVEAAAETQADRLADAVGELSRSEAEFRDEAEVASTLHHVGADLIAELDLDRLVQRATDAATAVTGAAFGSFFYNVTDELGESYLLFTLSGVPRENFEGFPMPRNTSVFAETFRGSAIVRSDDITMDPRYGRNPPHRGIPEGHLPVRSYLAVPAISPAGETLGGFFFGHPQPGRFTDRHERLAVGIAAQSAIALDNARLYRAQRNAAVELQRSLLPRIPAIPGLQVLSRYRPAARVAEVGGDWVDLVPLSAGRVALVAGDVMGKGIHAAAVMGQLRAAVRAYATLDLPPAQTIRLLNSAMAHLPSFEMATCVYGVLDPVSGVFCYASAGHLPPVLVPPGGPVELLDDPLGPPLGSGDLAYREREVTVPAGTGILLYTDGLVERRGRDLGAGLGALTAELERRPVLDESTVDELIDMLVEHDRHDDDLALLYVRQQVDLDTGAATYLLPAQPKSTREVRLFAIDTLVSWGVRDSRLDSVVLVIHELVSNAIRHARTDEVELHLRRLPGKLVIEVADADARLPFLIDPSADDEQHRGLHLVRACAERWGARPTVDGKVVWAEVAL